MLTKWNIIASRSRFFLPLVRSQSWFKAWLCCSEVPANLWQQLEIHLDAEKTVSGELILYMYLNLPWCFGTWGRLTSWSVGAGKLPLELPRSGLVLFPCPALALSPVFLRCALPLGCIQSGYLNLPKARQSYLLNGWIRRSAVEGDLCHPAIPLQDFPSQ